MDAVVYVQLLCINFGLKLFKILIFFFVLDLLPKSRVTVENKNPTYQIWQIQTQNKSNPLNGQTFVKSWSFGVHFQIHDTLEKEPLLNLNSCLPPPSYMFYLEEHPKIPVTVHREKTFGNSSNCKQWTCTENGNSWPLAPSTHTTSVLRHKVPAGALGSNAAWRSHTLIFLFEKQQLWVLCRFLTARIY